MTREKIGKKRKARVLQSNGVGETTALTSGTSVGGGKRTKDTSLAPSNTGELSALTLKFVKGLASRLVDDNDDSAEGAFRAAVAVLPKGKLRREIRGNMQAALVVLAGELDRLRAETKGVATVAITDVETISSNEELEKGESKARDGQQLDAPVEQAPVSSVDQPRTPPFLACTPRLYDLLRSTATGVGNEEADASTANDTLRALSFNPRSPVDLLSDTMGDELLKAQEKAVRSKTRAKRVQVAVARLKLLTQVLAVDPKAASSASGLAFVAYRAEAQAAMISANLQTEGSTSSKDGKGVSCSAAIEGLGLLLRILHVISLASAKPGVDPSRGEADHEIEVSTFRSSCESTAGGQLDDSASRADRLVLRCIPGTKHEGPGEDPVSVAQRSIARLLGHYAVSVATMCSLDCWQDGARELIRRVGHVSLGRKRGAVGQGGFDGAEEDDDTGTDSDAEESSGKDEGDNVALLRHMMILCVLHLRGDESSTLEFLRCVGDACVCREEDRRPPVAREVATALAPTCARVLSRLSRPNATSVVSPIRFLRRAYAFRLVEYLSSKRVKFGCGDGRLLLANLPVSSVGSRRLWDFVGDAPIPSSTKELLGTMPPPRGIKGSARTAYSALAEQRGDLRGIAEVLRSSPACTPYALGSLLDALGRMARNHVAKAEADGGGKQGDLQEKEKKKSKKGKEKLKRKKGRVGGGGKEDDVEKTAGLDSSEGFFIDTKGGEKPARGAGGISLAPLVDRRIRVDQSLPRDSSKGEGDEGDREEQAGEDK